MVDVIHNQHLFQPVITRVLQQVDQVRLPLMYIASGALSAISDNVFIAAVHIGRVEAAFLFLLTTKARFSGRCV